MIKDFLSKLGANTKITIGVSVTPGIGLEMIEIDRSTKTIMKYGCKPLEYNYSTREISDFSEFQKSLEELFNELHVPKKSNVILNMPNVQFGVISLPLLLIDEAVTNAIISEVEQSYIFKRQEPLVSWAEVSSNVDTENRTLAYTAIQQGTLDGIKAAFEEIGCTLLAIETSYASLLKTLYYSETTKEQMKDNISWNLMVIGQNNYSLFSMVGKKLIEYYEEPLALKSFVDDEIYNAITSSANLTLSSLPANYLCIVSETDLVSAEVLSMKISYEGTISFLECNKYVQNELLTVSLNILPNLALKISPESIGSAIYPFCDYPLKFNLTGEKESSSAEFLSSDGYPKVNIGSVEVEITPGFLKKVSLIFGGIIVVPAFIITFALGKFLSAEKTKVDALQTKIKIATEEIAKYSKASSEKDAFDLGSMISKITTQNRTKLFYYSALGMSVPNKLWVQYYATSGDNGVDIKGNAADVQSVYAFYKNMKQLVNNSDIKIYKLEIPSASIDEIIGNNASTPNAYTFEITNMTPEQLNPAAAPAAGTAGQPGAPGAPASTGGDEKKSIFQFGNPIFGPKNPTQAPANGQAPAPAPAPAPAAAPMPAPTAQPAAKPLIMESPKGDKLPKNLEKIEKF